ncbi:MAG: hypothetical protein ACYSUK_00035 [Planctomycetota bacterium]|jgi:hypothetical protein
MEEIFDHLTAESMRKTSQRGEVKEIRRRWGRIFGRIKEAANKGYYRVMIDDVLSPDFVQELNKKGYFVVCNKEHTVVSWEEIEEE